MIGAVTMKKILSLTLSLLFVLSVFIIPASAIHSNGSIDALRAQFSSGEGPSDTNIVIDYSYYSPVKSEDDTNKYPLVLFFPGSSGGPKKGDELLENDFARWTGDDIQAKFPNGGAYIMILRSRQDIGLYWDASVLTAPAKSAVDDFIAKNPNIDTSRVYAVGWSLGGNGARNFTIAYPNLVSGCALFSARGSISSTDASRLADTSVWIFQNKNDNYSYESYGLTSWANMKAAAHDLSKIRYSTADSAPAAGNWQNHGMWFPAVRDMRDTEHYIQGFVTVDGNGVEYDQHASLIEFFLASDQTHETASCGHNCHKAGFTSIFWKIAVIFYKFFNVQSKRICSCGVAHW